VRARARRRYLRQDTGPYGAQQARNLYTARQCDKGTPSARAYSPRFSVPDIIGPKASVAGQASPLGNPRAQRVGVRWKLFGLGPEDLRGTSGVGVKSCNPGRTTNGETTSGGWTRQ